MQKIYLVIIFVLSASIIYDKFPQKTTVTNPTVEVVKAKEKTAEELDLEHRQEVWISALEWCESAGRNTALNKVDRDGTPSYSNFQWKPTTLLYYGKMYDLIASSTPLASSTQLLKNYDLQREIVRHMVRDPKVNFAQQFPDCTKRKIGHPPRK